MKYFNRLFITASLLIIGFLAEAVVVTVGNGNDCDYDLLNGDSLQDAINFTDSDEVRLDINAVYPSIFINKPIKILGGFDNCTTAAQGVISSNVNILTNINGQNIDRVITINSTATGDVILENLSITNGFAGTELQNDRGGGIYVPFDNKASVKINSSVISNNTALAGAGIFMSSNTPALRSLILTDTKIHNNHAVNTGTIFTDNNGGGISLFLVDLQIQGNSGLFNNSVDNPLGLSYGGAIAAFNSKVTVIGGEDLPEVGFIQNTARYRGGAMYLSSTDLTLIGNIININGNPTGNISAPIKFIQNESIDNYGGAIFATDSSIQANDVLFALNTAKIAGGAIGIDVGELMMDSTPGQCWQDQACNVFSQNSAEFGGAIWANNGTDISVKHSLFNDNAANKGSSLNIGNLSTALFEAVVIINEGQSNNTLSNDEILFISNSSLIVNFSNIIENNNSKSIFNSLAAASSLFVSNSIIYNSLIPQMIDINNEGTVNYSCILGNSIENGAVNIGISNYNGLFVDVSNFNFRLKTNAYAIDFCDGSTPATTTDLQNLVRGFDDPTEVNVFGVFDAGANEYYVYNVGVNVTGLANGATLSVLNNIETLDVTSNGFSNFSTSYLDGNAYAVSITAQPISPNQVCSITSNNASGNINSSDVILDISCTTVQYNVGVDVTGLANGNSVIFNNQGESLTVTSDGQFNFATALNDGALYDVVVDSQPQMPNQICSIVSPVGALQGNDVLLTVTCTTNQYFVGGVVFGLANGNSVTLSLNAVDLNVNSNNAFVFSNTLTDLTPYSIVVSNQPTVPNQTCGLVNSSGTIAGNDITDIEVNCTTNQYKIGGTVTGLHTGNTIVIQNNSSDDLTINSNGNFNFDSEVDDLQSYNISIINQQTSPIQICTVSNNSGIVSGVDVMTVSINCAFGSDLIFENGFEL